MTDRRYTLSANSSLALDVVRALASQAVVLGHGISYFAIWPRLQPPDFPYLQNVAVVVFFVLSGFLIAYATLRKPAGYRFREFFVDRFARIYSAYLVVLPLVWAIDRWALHIDRKAYGYRTAFHVKTFVGNVFMLQDHPIQKLHDLGITSFGSARPLWTIAVEWWIYMCFGWIVLRRAKPLAPFLVVLAIFAFVPVENVLPGRGNGLAVVWMLGAAAFLLAGSVAFREARGHAFAAFAFAVVAALWLRETKEPYDVRFGALLSALLLCGVLALDRARWSVPALIARGIKFVAGYSFTLYLLHYTLLDLISHHPPFENPTASFLFAFVVCNVASILVAMVTEAHHRTFAAWLKRRLFS
jgi:peptidoglycan/LPS O-acetylase OafA/YrhL